MVGIFIVVLGLNSTNLITYPVTRGSTTSCFTATEINIASNLIALLMRVYLPYFFMCVFNIIVISRLKSSKRKVGTMTTTNDGQKVARRTGKLSRKEYKFTVATLLMDLFFLLMNTPVSVWLTMSTVDLFTKAFSSDTFVNTAFNLYANIAQLIAFSYSMSMIFVFIIFNRTFRDELIYLFRLRTFFPQNSTNSAQTAPTRTQMNSNM